MNTLVNLIKELYGVYRGDTLLIYTMGKVGSSSVKYSLELIGVPVVHLHNFTGEQYVDLGWQFRGVRSWLVVSLMKFRLRLIGLAFRSSRRARVITLVRDPVARNVSVMFQGLDRLITRGVRECGSDQKKVLQYIFENYVNHDIPVDWFKWEFEKHTGIDICRHDAGGRDYLLIKQKRMEVLVLKLEALKSLEKEIARFVGRPEFELRLANVGDRKWYAELYDNFKTDVQLGSDYLDRMYSAPGVTHLYSNEEITKFRARWASDLPVTS